jgi:isopropylmalate/homocitrate/citramalate synthase
MLKDPRSYEFLPAAWTGRRSRIVLGKHSGMSSIEHVLRERGLPPADDASMRDLLERVKHNGSARSKAMHVESQLAAAAMRGAMLAGVDPDVVLQSNGASNSMVVPRGAPLQVAEGE